MNSITSTSISEKKEIILGMDHNLDLLKSGPHKQTQLFLNDLLDKEIYPTITRPTRICHNAHSATNLNPSGLNLVVLELNIRSILSHLSDLKQLLHVLESKNSRVDIILLCETFLTKSTESLVKVPGYTLICSNRKHSKGGGTAILLRNGITFKRRTDIEIFREKEVESTIIEIVAKDGKKIVVCSMYRPPNPILIRHIL